MPRVAQVSRAGSVRVASGSALPMNDDAQEKEKRANSRKALQEKHINEIKASLTPSKSGHKLEGAEHASSRESLGGTPRNGRGVDDFDDGLLINGKSGTPVKRVPILANFEEWMKMATDNKINAANSWNFALIDYFHDMSLLKEGDGVNFQKASCTLDGCVKIYTNRVDSVATETGKLLSGLADSNSGKKKDRDGEEGEGDESDGEVDEDGNPKKKPKRKTQRSSEATLAPSFASLQLKKFELEFTVDPLFKKASADFDEGGAKGLLLNHLMIDSEGRIVFDSSDDLNDAPALSQEKEEDEAGDMEDEKDQTMNDAENEVKADEADDSVEIDLGLLRQKFFPDLSGLDALDVCPSLKTFDLGNPSGSVDIPFLRAPEDWRQDHDRDGMAGAFGDHSGMLIDDDAPAGFDDDDLGLGSFDVGGDVAFGEGGEAWAREAALEPHMRGFDNGMHDEDEGDGFDEGDEYVVSMSDRRTADKVHDNILGFFDQALQKNWASAEHWRIRKIKDANKPASESKKRKEKEPFEINFAAPLDQALSDLIFTQATSNSAISMPKKEWISKTHHLLPDDKHFNSRSLLSLFLKPKAHMSRRSGTLGGRSGVAAGASAFDFGHMQQEQVPEGDMDEAFWARHEGPAEDNDTIAPGGNYAADFFQDDAAAFPGVDGDDDELEFADAREIFSPELDGDAGLTEGLGMTALLNGETTTNALGGAFGTTLVTQTRRIRPEYVQYARVAKKVDVRRLKEEIWRGMGLGHLKEPIQGVSRLPTPPESDAEPSEPATPRPASPQPELQPSFLPPGEEDNDSSSLKFTSVMNDLKKVYPKPMMDDISTSFCFIALLHLANEKGLIIGKTPELTELDIRRDWTAEATEGAA